MELCSSAPQTSLYFKSFVVSLSTSSISSPYSFKPTDRFTSLRISRKYHQLAHSPKRLSICVRSSANDVIKDPLSSDLLVKETQESNCRIRLSVEVPAVVCEDCYERVIDEFMKRVTIPGVRPGKQVPEEMLVRYIGKDGVRKAAVEAILKTTLPHAMSSVEGRALPDSIRITTSFSEMEKTYSSLDILRYEVVVDVAPEVKWVPEDGYKNLKIVVELDSEIEAKIAAERELKRCYKTLSTMRIVNDRGLQVGDVAVLDISATTMDGSEVKDVPAAASKGFNFDTEDADTVVPGFLDAIIGIQRGETKSFPLAFPDSWKEEDLRGLPCQFTVECKELFYRELPEMNDAIADKLLPGCSTIEQVKKLLLERCIELEQTAKDQATDNAILDQLQKMVQVEIPESLFEEQGRQLYGGKLLEMQMQSNVKLNEEQLEALSSPKAVKEYLENQRENIENLIKQSFAVGDIFKRENLQFSTDELVKEVENSVAEFKKHRQEYDEESIQAQVQEILEAAKVLEWLRENADIQYVTN